MSIRVMTRIWDSGLYEGGTLLVMLALADWGGDDGGRIFPSINQIGEKTRLTERQVYRVLKGLRADGVLVKVSSADGTPGVSNSYRIDLAKLDELAVINAREKLLKSQGIDTGDIDCDDEELGDIDDSDPRHLTQEGVTNGHPHIEEPLTEPSREPLLAKKSVLQPEKQEEDLPPRRQAKPREPVQATPKRPGRPSTKTAVPAVCPGSDLRDEAVTLWRQDGRPDLIAGIDRQAELFRNFHRGKGTRSDDWPALWRSWMLRAPEMNRAPRTNGGGYGSAPSSVGGIENLSDEGWRVACDDFFYGTDDRGDGTPIPKGTWRPSLGPAPGQPGCRAPEAVLAKFASRRGAVAAVGANVTAAIRDAPSTDRGNDFLARSAKLSGAFSSASVKTGVRSN